MPLFLAGQNSQQPPQGTSLGELLQIISALQSMGLKGREEQRGIKEAESSAQKQAMANRLKARGDLYTRQKDEADLKLRQAKELREKTLFEQEQAELEKRQAAQDQAANLFSILRGVPQVDEGRKLPPERAEQLLYAPEISQRYGEKGAEGITNIYDILEKKRLAKETPIRPSAPIIIEDKDSTTGWSAYIASTDKTIKNTKAPWEPSEDYKGKRETTYVYQEQLENLKQANRKSLVTMKENLAQSERAEDGIALTRSIAALLNSPNPEDYEDQIADGYKILNKHWPRGAEYLSDQVVGASPKIKTIFKAISSRLGLTRAPGFSVSLDEWLDKAQPTAINKKKQAIDAFKKEFPGFTQEEIEKELKEAGL